MQIGWGQLLFIGFLVFLLFGNLPKLLKDLTTGIQEIKKTQKEKSSVLNNKVIEEDLDKNKKKI
jgi:Sec-independent protein translocase protein TatA